MLVAVAVIALVAVFAAGGGPAEIEEKPRVGTVHEEQAPTHMQTVDDPHEPYNTNPATSGAHLAQPPADTYGIYEHQLRDEEILHGLEHGAVGIWYNAATVSDTERQQLIDIFNDLPAGTAEGTPKAYLIPREGLDNNVKVALVAWTYSLDLEGIDSGAINDFYESHVNKGPERAP